MKEFVKGVIQIALGLLVLTLIHAALPYATEEAEMNRADRVIHEAIMSIVR